MSDLEPHDCPKGCHPLRASDGVSPACSDTCQRPNGHGPPWCLIPDEIELRVFYDTAIMFPGLDRETATERLREALKSVPLPTPGES